MYNKELKQSFVREYTQNIHTIRLCEVTFNTIEKYEEAWGKDFCQQDKEEVQEAVDAVTGLRGTSKLVKICILQAYVKWCCDHKYPGAQMNMSDIDKYDVSRFRELTVISPAHLQKYLDEIFYPDVDHTAHNTMRCFAWLGYMGLKVEDILSLTNDNIDLSNQVVRVGGHQYQIYPESLITLKSCMYDTEFIYRHPRYKDTVRSRVGGKQLLRGVRNYLANEVVMCHQFGNYVSRAYKNGMSKQRLSYYRVWLSGVFYRAYQQEKIGFEPDFSFAAEKLIDGKEYHGKRGSDPDKKKRAVMSELRADYNRWKIAYML